MKFEFNVDEVNIILQGLGELPAKLSMNIIARIQEDAAKQMQPEMKSEEGAEKNSRPFPTQVFAKDKFNATVPTIQ